MKIKFIFLKDLLSKQGKPEPAEPLLEIALQYKPG